MQVAVGGNDCWNMLKGSRTFFLWLGGTFPLFYTIFAVVDVQK